MMARIASMLILATFWGAVLTAAALPFWAVLSTPVGAEVCGQRDTVLRRLAHNFGETRRALGLGANNGVIEVFASDVTGSWTITVTMPDGRMCLVASGRDYEETPAALKHESGPEL